MRDRLAAHVSTLAGQSIALFGRVPVIGELTRCSKGHHASALREFFVLIAFSTATFWLTAFIAGFWDENRTISYTTLLARTVGNGELTIFCVSMLGPIFYTALDNPRWAKRDFPEKIVHAVVAVIVAIAASTLFAVSRVPIPKNLELVVIWSYVLAGVAILLRYLTVLYAKARQDDPADIWRDSMHSFIAQALRRRHDK